MISEAGKSTSTDRLEVVRRCQDPLSPPRDGVLLYIRVDSGQTTVISQSSNPESTQADILAEAFLARERAALAQPQ